MKQGPGKSSTTYALGIDLGTTNIAAVILDSETKAVQSAVSFDVGARIPDSSGHRAEYDVEQILRVLKETLESLDPELLAKVGVIGIDGQMHGVMLWNSLNGSRTNLISWQDQRAGEGDFLRRLRQRTGDAELQSGYGCVTLAWIAENQPELFKQYDRASTVADYLAAQFTGDAQSRTDPTNAASWGLYDVLSRGWDMERIGWAELPKNLIPQVLPSRSIRGVVSPQAAKEYGIPAGIPIAMPIGDHPAAMLSALSDPEHEIVLNLGTGGQLSVVLRPQSETVFPIPSGLELRPYPDGRIAAVAATLCAGKAFEWIVENLIAWCRELGGGALERMDVYARLNEFGVRSLESPLDVSSSLMGERHAPSRRGSIRELDLNNFTLGNLSAGIARDIAENLRSMMPASFLKGRTSIVGSGKALRRSPLMQQTVEQVFGLPVHLADTIEEAACGAALHAIETAGNR